MVEHGGFKTGQAAIIGGCANHAGDLASAAAVPIRADTAWRLEPYRDAAWALIPDAFPSGVTDLAESCCSTFWCASSGSKQRAQRASQCPEAPTTINSSD